MKRKDDIDSLPRTEKIIVFIVAYVLAISLWLLVNLNRDFNLTVMLPVQIARFQDDLALVEEPPEEVTVNMVGEGWKLISIYNNPPALRVDARQGPINLTDRVKETMGMYLDVNVQNVNPTILNVPMEEKITRKVPIEPHVSIAFRRQYDLVGEPGIIPDSVEVAGARSLVEDIASWPTEEVQLEDVSDTIHHHIPLREPSELIELDVNEVVYRAPVAEYTEGETRIQVRTEGMPEDREVRFSPSVITVRYDVPIHEYAQSQDIVPFEAVVPYTELVEDTTGLVTPSVHPIDHNLNLRLRSTQPRRVSYYNVLVD
ncbi:MAG: hypothetical protein WDZ53_09735 [Balneolales bacterium]